MYARRTKVDANKTQSEIISMLKKRNAEQFMIGGSRETAMLAFEIGGWRLKFMLPLRGKKRGTELQLKQEERRRWRALNLVLKAKFEAVDSGIVEFEREFLPFIVTTGMTTVGDQVINANGGLAALVSTGKLPPLLGPGTDEPRQTSTRAAPPKGGA